MHPSSALVKNVKKCEIHTPVNVVNGTCTCSQKSVKEKQDACSFRESASFQLESIRSYFILCGLIIILV